MQNEVFEEILRCVKTPLGELLNDQSTYRVLSKDFSRIKTKHLEELYNFDKFLVVTDKGKTVVGGVLFYGSADIQEFIFPEYRGQHFMSVIHKNGVLKGECYPKQNVTIDKEALNSFDDFQMKHYLASCIDLRISNLREIYRYFEMFKLDDEYQGFHAFSEEEFIKVFS